MKKLTLLLLVFCITFSSCRKKEVLPTETTGEPVFYLRGTLNDMPLEVKAGDEGYYMYTSVYQDENNIYVFKGDLKAYNNVANISWLTQLKHVRSQCDQLYQRLG